MVGRSPCPQHKDEEAAVVKRVSRSSGLPASPHLLTKFLEKVPQSWSQEDVGFIS